MTVLHIAPVGSGSSPNQTMFIAPAVVQQKFHRPFQPFGNGFVTNFFRPRPQGKVSMGVAIAYKLTGLILFSKSPIT